MATLTEDKVHLAHGFSPRVFRGGAGDGPPIVFCHAASGVSATDPVVGTLADRFSVTAPLAPGFHDVIELEDIRDIHELALWYDDVFAALGIDHAAVVGHSFGGMVAAELAAHVPHRVDRLVLVAPVGLWSDDDPVADLFGVPTTDLNDFLWGDPDSPVAQMARAQMAALAERDPSEVVDQLVTMVQGLTAVAKFMWPIPDRGIARRLHRIAADTLVIWGSNDRLVPVSYAERWAELIPNARTEILDGAGHMCTIERLDDFIDLVAAHVGAAS